MVTVIYFRDIWYEKNLEITGVKIIANHQNALHLTYSNVKLKIMIETIKYKILSLWERIGEELSDPLIAKSSHKINCRY